VELFALRYVGGFGKPELPTGGFPESGPALSLYLSIRDAVAQNCAALQQKIRRPA
jgi:hypothetical protein